MKAKYKIGLGVVLAAAVVAVTGWWLSKFPVPVLRPAGEIGKRELHLLIFASCLAVAVIIPVFILTIFIALRYRESNHENARKKPKYRPDYDRSWRLEAVWWGIPIAIIGTLSVVVWVSTHSLDPYKAISSTKQTLTIQVVSLDWKWLFIYPGQNVASVNQAAIPTGVPVDFHVTSDTIMNSFWVPALGGQIYAMPGMDTQLHELVNKPGSYLGSPANIAGHGFSRMDFTVQALPQAQFDAWVSHAKESGRQLTPAAYAALAKPSDSTPVGYYAGVQNDLYNTIVMKYMMPEAAQ